MRSIGQDFSEDVQLIWFQLLQRTTVQKLGKINRELLQLTVETMSKVLPAILLGATIPGAVQPETASYGNKPIKYELHRDG